MDAPYRRDAAAAAAAPSPADTPTGSPQSDGPAAASSRGGRASASVGRVRWNVQASLRYSGPAPSQLTTFSFLPHPIVELGRGTFGRVLQMRDEISRRPYAVKICFYDDANYHMDVETELYAGVSRRIPSRLYRSLVPYHGSFTFTIGSVPPEFFMPKRLGRSPRAPGDVSAEMSRPPGCPPISDSTQMFAFVMDVVESVRMFPPSPSSLARPSGPGASEFARGWDDGGGGGGGGNPAAIPAPKRRIVESGGISGSSSFGSLRSSGPDPSSARATPGSTGRSPALSSSSSAVVSVAAGGGGGGDAGMLSLSDVDPARKVWMFLRHFVTLTNLLFCFEDMQVFHRDLARRNVMIYRASRECRSLPPGAARRHHLVRDVESGSLYRVREDRERPAAAADLHGDIASCDIAVIDFGLAFSPNPDIVTPSLMRRAESVRRAILLLEEKSPAFLFGRSISQRHTAADEYWCAGLFWLDYVLSVFLQERPERGRVHALYRLLPSGVLAGLAVFSERLYSRHASEIDADIGAVGGSIAPNSRFYGDAKLSRHVLDQCVVVRYALGPADPRVAPLLCSGRLYRLIDSEIRRAFPFSRWEPGAMCADRPQWDQILVRQFQTREHLVEASVRLREFKFVVVPLIRMFLDWKPATLRDIDTAFFWYQFVRLGLLEPVPVADPRLESFGFPRDRAASPPSAAAAASAPAAPRPRGHGAQLHASYRRTTAPDGGGDVVCPKMDCNRPIGTAQASARNGGRCDKCEAVVYCSSRCRLVDTSHAHPCNIYLKSVRPLAACGSRLL